MGADWRNGFLFVGNLIALDFLNTRPVAVGGGPVELLPDCNALVRWLAASGLIAKPHEARVHRTWASLDCDAAVNQLLRFRESLRKTVLELEAGTAASVSFIAGVNRLLLEHPYPDQIAMGKAGFERRRQFDPRTPLDVFAPLADGVADLLTNVDPSRLRKCQTCVLHFYDTSKKGTRVWCSMNLCGNRFKVAAYAERKRLEARN